MNMTSTQDTTSPKTQSATGQQHHHHHHHHMDDSERYKRDNFNSMKRQPIIEKLIFILLSIAAIALMAFVYWIYTTE